MLVSEASGRGPGGVAEYTGGVSPLSDAISPVVIEIRRRLHLHALSSLVGRRHSRVTAGISLFALRGSLVLILADCGLQRYESGSSTLLNRSR